MNKNNELRDKVEQIEEQLRLAMAEYPQKIALDRLKFASALARFVGVQMSIDDSNAALRTDFDTTVSQVSRSS